MALPVETQLKYWGLAALIIFATLYLLGDVLLPFILGGAIAYLLDPIADWLERRGLGRGPAVAVISIAFLCLVAAAALLIWPPLRNQTIGLVEALPELASSLRAFLDARIPGGLSENSMFAETIGNLGDTLREKGMALVNRVLSSALSLMNILFLLFVVPVVSIYLLIDWDRLVARIDDLLPRDHAPTIRVLAREMDKTLGSFLYGQGMVVLIQGTFYAVALMAAGLNFGLLVGFVSGALSFIPFVGSITGFVIATGLAVFQFWGDWLHIALIAGIFVFGQVVEGNILTPKLVGSSVGLHPVWLLLALSVFGALFGFVGMLIAVPLAAMLGVLVRFGVGQYKDGRLYQGHHGRMPPDDEAAPDSAADDPPSAAAE